MWTAVIIVVVLLVLAGVAYALTRKPPELPERREPRKLPEREPQRRARAEERAEKKPPEKRVSERPAREAPLAPSERPPEAEEAEGVLVEGAPAKAAAPARRIEPREDLQAMRLGLAKSRESNGFFGRLFAVFGGKKEISPEITEQIEEVLLSSDVGVKTSQTLLARVRDSVGSAERVNVERVWDVLRSEAIDILRVDGKAGPFALSAKPTVVLMVGVNGSGKTTTIGKLATRLKASGLVSVLAAGDTFRAAAVQQLVIWGQRVGCEVVKGKDGADPGSVVFDAIKRAEEIGADVVLADTAGRLHTKSNLMAEMKKIAKTAAKALPGAPHEVLLVLDATNGQNALAQAKEFRESLELTGIVLTKLDGTAKGGMVLGICDTLHLPVRFVGLGERPHDLHDFVPEAFVEALLGREGGSDGSS